MSPSTSEILLQLAADADDRADEYLARTAASGLDRDECLERSAFYRGQASGFRQSVYYVTLEEGTPVAD